MYRSVVYLEVQLWSNPHVQFHVEVVVVCGERLSWGSTRDYVHHWCFHLHTAYWRFNLRQTKNLCQILYLCLSPLYECVCVHVVCTCVYVWCAWVHVCMCVRSCVCVCEHALHKGIWRTAKCCIFLHGREAAPAANKETQKQWQLQFCTKQMWALKFHTIRTVTIYWYIFSQGLEILPPNTFKSL